MNSLKKLHAKIDEVLTIDNAYFSMGLFVGVLFGFFLGYMGCIFVMMGDV